MTFTGRLRLALIGAALLPTILITLIVVAGISEQLKRIENREAQGACRRFTELLEHTVTRVRINLDYIAASRDFQLVTWNIHSGKRPDPTYTLPPLSLDFVEYSDGDGTILLSAARPAMVGRTIEPGKLRSGGEGHELTYESDSRGTHPSVTVTLPTENGFLRGGIFLDEIFDDLAAAVTRSSIRYIDLREAEAISPPGVPYRSGGTLYAVLAYDSAGAFYPLASFEPAEAQSIFSNFLTAVAAVTLFSLMVVIPAGLYFSSRTRRALNGLTSGAGRVASGDFSRPVPGAVESEFSELADSFNYMMRQLDTYRERLLVSQKIAAWQTIGRRIAHEIKNPLTPITIAVDDLRLSYHENKADFEKILNECTDAIKQQVHHLKKLIEEFSEFAKMPPPEFTTVSSAELLQPLTVLFKEELDSGQVRIEDNAGDAELRLDPDQMEQVIINLVKNSLEAGCRACAIRLTVTDDRIELHIEDDGPGFPKRLLDEGMTPYFSTKEGGSGLGLVICQRIVFDHNGVMSLENKPEGGARVIISVPQTDVQNSDYR